MIYSTV